MSMYILASTIAVCAFSTFLWAADPMAGTWKLNLSESKFETGPAPRTGTIRVDEEGLDFRVTADGINSEGKPVKFSFTVRKDGKEYPVTGPEGTGTTSWRRVDDHTTEMVFRMGGKEVGRNDVVVSPDGRRQTVKTSGIDVKGQKHNSVVIYDKL